MDIFNHLNSINPRTRFCFSPVSVSYALSVCCTGNVPSDYVSSTVVVKNKVYINAFKQSPVRGTSYTHFTNDVVHRLHKEVESYDVRFPIKSVNLDAVFLSINVTRVRLRWKIPLTEHNPYQTAYGCSNDRLYSYNEYAFSHLKQDRVKIIELPCDDDYSVVLITHDSRSTITPDKVTGWLHTTRLRYVNVSLPKGSTETGHNVTCLTPAHVNLCHRCRITITKTGVDATAFSCVDGDTCTEHDTTASTCTIIIKTTGLDFCLWGNSKKNCQLK
ncbi:m152R [Myxoma virus]|uniref:M152R n=1 Tax=Myxoma virus TaxID=10273 RepID=K4JCR9_9POXV|nr:m152R [Myxoma virus]QAV38520.1 m152R [Myxoma virus]QAV38858.1 m152R [Myxoma virus]QAV41562.1 m152R [Myxoma virus]QAV42914.1 m152R [Myxoma virus]